MFKFSIVIPCLNEEGYILNLLHSLEKQSLSLNDFEVIVVDNNSTDKTAQTIWDYATKSHLNIKMLHEFKPGVSAARNSGARIALGDVLVFLDADNVVKYSFLMSLFSYVESKKFLAGTIRTMPDKRDFKALFVFLILETIKLLLPKPFGKSFVNNKIFKKSGGYNEKIVLGENVFFLQNIKTIINDIGGKFGHFNLGLKCSVRRFEKEGYMIVLAQWLLAYIGIKNLKYKTMVDINKQ